MQFVSDASFVLVDLDDFYADRMRGRACNAWEWGGGGRRWVWRNPHPTATPSPLPQIENLNLFQSLNFLAVALEMV